MLAVLLLSARPSLVDVLLLTLIAAMLLLVVYQDATQVRRWRALAIRFSVATSLALAMAVAFYGDWWDVIPWCWCGW